MINPRKTLEIDSQEMLEGVTMRMAIGPDQGATHFNMRIFDLQPGASTPHHSHWWEHEVYVMAGKGIVKDETGEKAIEAGMALLVPGGEKHQFVNTGDGVLRFMCLVPQEWLENGGQRPVETDEPMGCMG